MACPSLPHFNSLEKFHSSFGLESEFFPFLMQATHSFFEAEKRLINQMDKIQAESDRSYKGGKIYGSSLSPEDPIKASRPMEKYFQMLLFCIT